MDDQRFEQLWREYRSSVLRYCAFSLGSREDAEDAAAEAFSRLLCYGDSVRPNSIEAWIFTVTRNVCATQHRVRSRSSGLLGKLSSQRQDEAPDPADTWREPEVWHELRSLDERARLVVYLRAVEDRTFTEIAQATGASEGATKMTYYRALRRLRHTMLASEPLDAPAHAGGATDVD